MISQNGLMINGPPRSLTLPLNHGCFVNRSISRIIESTLRDWMNFP